MKLLFDVFVVKGNNEKDRRNISWYNIIMLSISMLLLFSTLRTLVNGLKVIVWEMHLSDPSSFVNTDLILGYSILLSSFTYFFSPWIVVKTTPRIWLIVFGFCIILVMAQFFVHVRYFFYIICAITGITASISNTARIHYISLNSFYSTIEKNSEVFWAIAQGSMFLPNYFLYMIITDVNGVNIPLRNYQIVCAFLLICALIGFIFVSFLGAPVNKHEELYFAPWLLILQALELISSKDISILAITFAYNGLQDTFMSGVYSNVIGFTNSFSSQDRLPNVFLSGMITALGTAIGVISTLLFKRRFNIRWHFKIFTVGALLHLISYILIILNIPNDAVLHPTDNQSLYMSNFSVALFCSFLQGLGDYYMHAQLYELLLDKFQRQITTVIFLENFITKLCASLAYFYNSTKLFIVVGILMAMEVCGVIAFYIVEFRAKIAAMDEIDNPRPFTSKY